MPSVLVRLLVHRRATPADLRSALRGLDRRLLVLVPDQRPAQRLAPEVADGGQTVAGQRADESAAGEKVAAGFGDAELVALGIREHEVSLLGQLTDVDVSPAEGERPL